MAQTVATWLAPTEFDSRRDLSGSVSQRVVLGRFEDVHIQVNIEAWPMEVCPVK
jgi:hypothetical protein